MNMYNKPQNGNVLSDEEAAKKANAPWFDNQAGQVEWIKPATKNHKPQVQSRPRPQSFKQMSYEQLEALYLEQKQRLTEYRGLPAALQKLTAGKMLEATEKYVAIKIELKRKSTPEQRTLLNEMERLRGILSQQSRQISQLKTDLLKQEQLRGAKKNKAHKKSGVNSHAK